MNSSVFLQTPKVEGYRKIVQLLNAEHRLFDIPLIRDVEGYIRWAGGRNASFPFLLEIVYDGEFAGFIGFNRIELGEGYIHCGVSLPFRRGGVFTEAFYQFLCLTSQVRGVSSYRLETLETNRAMQLAAVKVGFFFVQKKPSVMDKSVNLFVYELPNDYIRGRI